MKVYFIGAGPGDPELITLKGKKIINSADKIIYAGSLVNPEVISERKVSSVVYDSAGMSLNEVISVIKESNSADIIARVHTGDPSIYGAIREQIEILKEEGIEYEVIPGVSSFTASAAALGMEFTLPGVTQTVICTRMSGRTEVPEKESLEKLASHKASMAIFLSVHMIEGVVESLLKGGYEKATPVAIVKKATWKDQKIIVGTLSDIVEKLKGEDISRMAQILVGDFLGNKFELSKLYDEKFSHGYRKRIE